MFLNLITKQNLTPILCDYVTLSADLISNFIEGNVQDWGRLLENISQSGCRQSFKEVFSHFYPLLISHFQKSGISKQNSSELAQECMLKVWNNASKFNPNFANPSTWIYIIARNSKFDYFRKLRNDPLHASSQDIYEGVDFQLDSNLELLEINKYLARLSIEQKNVIEMMYLEGLTQQEIAEQTKIPLGTVKSRIRLALSSLKNMMEEK